MAKIHSITLTLTLLAVTLVVSSSVSQNTRTPFPQDPAWAQYLNNKVQRLAIRGDGELGVYVKDEITDQVYSYNAHRDWYLASAVKVPVAIEVYRQVAEGILTDRKPIVLKETDYRDGAGSLNWQKPGTEVSLKYLVEQMLIESDNAATDILIEKVGLDNVNENLTSLVPWGFHPITTLLDVRRMVYAEFHQSANSLTNYDFIDLKKIKGEANKLKRISEILKISDQDFTTKNINEAYENFYRKNYNSATLSAYAKLLEKIIEGKTVEPQKWPRLIDVMARCKTGEKRIKAGFPKNWVFAHKTGTQNRRICDFGVAWKDGSGRKVIIAACVEKFKSLDRAERTLKQLGQLIVKSKVLE